jgi:hypothetical protein
MTFTVSRLVVADLAPAIRGVTPRGLGIAKILRATDGERAGRPTVTRPRARDGEPAPRSGVAMSATVIADMPESTTHGQRPLDGASLDRVVGGQCVITL